VLSTACRAAYLLVEAKSGIRTLRKHIPVCSDLGSGVQHWGILILGEAYHGVHAYPGVYPYPGVQIRGAYPGVYIPGVQVLGVHGLGVHSLGCIHWGASAGVSGRVRVIARTQAHSDEKRLKQNMMALKVMHSGTIFRLAKGLTSGTGLERTSLIGATVDKGRFNFVGGALCYAGVTLVGISLVG